MLQDLLQQRFALTTVHDESEALALKRLDASSAAFFHCTPMKVRQLAQPIFELLEENSQDSPCGYVDLGNGKEMFVVRRCCDPSRRNDRVPWPLSPSNFQSDVLQGMAALHRTALDATASLIKEILTREMVPTSDLNDKAQTLLPLPDNWTTLVDTFFASAPFDVESILFLRHYSLTSTTFKTHDMMMSSHTDSGILTVLFCPNPTALRDLQFLTADRAWVSPAPHDDSMVMVMFVGEMFYALLHHILTEVLGLRSECLQRQLPSLAAVHCVHSAAVVPHISCRHSYPFQLRLPLDLLLRRSRSCEEASGRVSALKHKLIVF